MRKPWIQRGERLRFAMAILLRTDFDASQVRAAAKAMKDGPQVRRLLALAAIYDGDTRGEAARIGGVTLQIVRDWVSGSTPMVLLGWLTTNRPAGPQDSTTRTGPRWRP